MIYRYRTFSTFLAFSLFSLLNFIVFTKWFHIMHFQQQNIVAVYHETVPDTEPQHFTQACSEPCQTSRMERFTKIISALKLLTISENAPSCMFDWVLNTPLF